MSAARRSPRPTAGGLLYLSDGYPKLAETFTMRDVHALRAAGLLDRVLSLHAPGPGDPAPDAARDPPVDVLPHPLSGAVLASALRCLGRRPLEAFRLAALVVSPHTKPFSWAWQVRAPLHWLWGAHVACSAPAGSHFHAQFLGAASTVAWVAARLSGGSFSVSAHADWALPLARPKLREALMFLAISETTRRDLLALAPEVPHDRVITCRLGVDVPARERATPQRARLRVVAVGSIGPTKGHDVLVRAMALAIGRGGDLELEIIGGGPGLPALQALVDDLALGGRVTLRGRCSHAETLETLRRDADIVALACRVTERGDVDGIPIALMEGMAAGKVVVSTRVGAIPELIEDGVSGRLVAPDRPDAFADALLELAADESLRARLGDEGRRRVAAEHEASGAASRLVGIFAERLGALSPQRFWGAQEDSSA